jgi:hypothetical protein
MSKILGGVKKPTTSEVDVKIKTVMESVIQLIREKHLQ